MSNINYLAPKGHMKILFLDIDGVLNNLKILSASKSSDPLGEDHLKLLKILVNATNCKIVLISTWRLYPESMKSLNIAFQEHEIPLWIDITPYLNTTRRADEILNWIKSNITVPTVAIGIDDDEDIDIGKDHQMPVKYKPIKTCFNDGLTEEIVQEAIDWLNNCDKC